MNLPEKTHTMQCHHFDSTRWDYYEPRDDDIIVATSYKAGTTWTQALLVPPCQGAILVGLSPSAQYQAGALQRFVIRS